MASSFLSQAKEFYQHSTIDFRTRQQRRLIILFQEEIVQNFPFRKIKKAKLIK